MDNALTRRNFVAGAAVATAAAAALGAQAAMADEAAAQDALPWDYAADIVICGLGVCGAMGAREAAKQGLSCIVIEAAPKELAGGASACFGGYYVPSATPESLMAGGMDEAGATALAAQAGDDFNWMLANGMPVSDIMKVEGAGRGFYETLAAAFETLGTPVLYETRATSLVTDPATGEVVGVEAQAADGSTLRLQGRKGVLLATGAAVADPDLVADYFFPQVEVLNVSSPYNRGDGLTMALALGAKLHNMTNFGIELQELALTKASREVGTALAFWPAGENAGARLIVNGSGERFMNEELDLAHYKGVCPWLAFPGAPQLGGYEGHVNLPMYAVFDSQLMGSEVLGEGLVDYGWAISKDVYRWSADNQAELEKGWIAQGETVEELAAALAESSGNDAVDAAALQQTIDAFNELASSGEADPLGRTDLKPLDQPPFYAAELSMTAMYTIGGLTAGADGRTLNTAGEWIPGLWHAGDVGQPFNPAVLGACPAGAIAGLAVRDMAAAPTREIAGEVLNEVEPLGEAGVAIATNGTGGAAA